MHRTNPKVDAFLGRATTWREELAALRRIVLDCGLTEELKWGKPCYTVDGGNVVILTGFKAFCALGFFKGALLADAGGILARPGENTRAARLIRFTSVEEITDLEPTVTAYLREAIEIERAGLAVDLTNTELGIPEELEAKMDDVPALRDAFFALTPGRQRAYVLHFAAPKQSATRTSRIERHMQRILDGQGLRDR